MERALENNWVRRNAPGFVRSLATALGREPETLELSTGVHSRQLISTFYERRKRVESGVLRGFYKRWLISELEQLKAVLSLVRLRVNDREVWLLRAASDRLGAVRFSLREALLRALDLVSLDQEALQVITEDGSTGLEVDYSSDSTIAAQYVDYQLTMWGDTFMQALEKTPPI